MCPSMLLASGWFLHHSPPTPSTKVGEVVQSTADLDIPQPNKMVQNFDN